MQPRYFQHQTDNTAEGHARLRELLLEDGLVPVDLVEEVHSDMTFEIVPNASQAYVVGVTSRTDPFLIHTIDLRGSRKRYEPRGQLVPVDVGVISASHPLMLDVLDASKDKPRTVDMTIWMITTSCAAFDPTSEIGQKLAGSRSKMIAELRHWFRYHPPTPGQPEIYERVREKALDLALLIEALAPDSQERSLAFTKLRESVMWANAAIACNPKVPQG